MSEQQVAKTRARLIRATLSTDDLWLYNLVCEQHEEVRRFAPARAGSPCPSARLMLKLLKLAQQAGDVPA